MANKLTGKQQAFINAYLANGHNATQAAEDAKYKGSRGTLQSIGTENLSKPVIKQAITKQMQELAEKTTITVKLQQQRHARLALLAEEKGDLATATRNEELIGKTIGAYIDKQVSVDDVKRLTAREREEARRIAAIRLRTG